MRRPGMVLHVHPRVLLPHSIPGKKLNCFNDGRGAVAVNIKCILIWCMPLTSDVGIMPRYWQFH